MKRKIEFAEYQNIVFFTMAMTAIFAYLDTIGAKMWATVGGWEGIAYTLAFPYYMKQFWYFAFLVIGVIAFTYYIIVKDKSEAVGIFIAGVTAIWSGLEDVFFYIISGLPLDQSMPWLLNTTVGTMSRFLGYNTVTPLTLFLNIIVFFFIGYNLVIYFYNQKC